ncbi:MAG: cell cycle protein [Acidimicrobiaceae bacterium]|nr:cell cycle protein [Acidimicrobiaceae bacterium]
MRALRPASLFAVTLPAATLPADAPSTGRRGGRVRRPKPRRRAELGLLLVGAVAVLFATLLESLAKTNALPSHVVSFIVGLALIVLYIQAVNRRLVPDADPLLLPVALLLNGIGYVMIERIVPTSAGQQVAWTVIGLGVYTLLLLIVRRSRDLERYRYLMAAVAFLLLVSPLFPVIGNSAANQGVKLWVAFHGIEFQPVEVAKLLLVIFFASYFVEKRELLTIPTRRIGNHLLPDLRAFGPIAVAGAMSLLVILGEHDIGFSLILFVVFLTMIWVTTGRWTYLAIGLALFVVATFLASHVLSQVNERIQVWLDPWKYATGIGDQPVQGELAFGRGGLFGTGIGLGTGGNTIPGTFATQVPVAQSDYIFSIIGEELGLAGAAAVVLAYLLLVVSGFRAAVRARSEFAKLAAVGLTATLGFQAFFIMAGVVRLLPLTGVTLPFVSYGGSSLVANYALLALLMRISNEANQPVVPSSPTPSWSRTSGATRRGGHRV